jgi:hypothetical protein
MKLRILAAVMLVVTIFAVYLAAPANAENSKDVNKLLGNNSCFWCDRREGGTRISGSPLLAGEGLGERSSTT